MKELTELDALKAYASMMNTLETDSLAQFLSPDLRYNSQWVFEEIQGKKEYLDYMGAKFESVTASGKGPYAEIGELAEYPLGHCVILAQGSIDNLIATVLVGIKNGLIARIDMCAVPDPYAAKRTGEYPGKR